MDLSRIEEALDEPLYDQLGRVSKVVGLTIESIGPEAKLNDLCKIQTAFGSVVMAEVVGFNDKRLILMPFESTEGIAVGSIVTNTGKPLSIPVGDALLGHTVDGIGRIDDLKEEEE